MRIIYCVHYDFIFFYFFIQFDTYFGGIPNYNFFNKEKKKLKLTILLGGTIIAGIYVPNHSSNI